MSTPTRCPTCKLPEDDRTLREIIEKAIRASWTLQCRDQSMPFSLGDMAGDILDAIRIDQDKARRA